jgi:hypothetical protein
MRRSLYLALLLSACAREPAPSGDLTAARQLAARQGRMLLAHFRLPGRPLSDAMDAALTPERLRALAPEFAHCRVDAERELAALRRAVGGSERRGAGLATCLLDAHGDALAISVGMLDERGFAAFVAHARSVQRELAAHLALPEPERSVALAAHWAHSGRSDLANARLHALTDADASATRALGAAGLARLAAQDGDVARAQQWLAVGDALPQTERLQQQRALTAALVALARRAPREALAALARSPAPDDVAEHLLCLGRACHECGDKAGALRTLAELQARFPATTYATAAAREVAHVLDPDHGHSHGDERP